jgi:hypothetical protein
MRKFGWQFLALLLAIQPAVFGQSDLSKQTDAVNTTFTLTLSYNQTNPGIEFTGVQTVKPGSWVSFRIRKTNISDHEIVKTSHTGDGYGYDFEVRDSNGNLVGPRHPNEVRMIGGDKGGILLCAKCNVLQPGESKIDFVPLASWFDMSKPGTYAIQASAHISDDPKSSVVKSNIVTVTVQEPDSSDVTPQ